MLTPFVSLRLRQTCSQTRMDRRMNNKKFCTHNFQLSKVKRWLSNHSSQANSSNFSEFSEPEY